MAQIILNYYGYFNAQLPPMLKILFAKHAQLGVGTVKIYSKDKGFQSEKLESKLPDQNGIPHWGTMIVMNSEPCDLRVCGKPIKFSGLGNGSFVAAFSLDCPYEILPLERWVDNHVHTFPIFGVYQGLHIKNLSEEATSIYDEIIKHINESDPFSSNLAELQGYISALRDDVATDLITRIRYSNKDTKGLWKDATKEYVSKEYIEATFTDSKNNKRNIVSKNPIHIPDGSTNIIISMSYGQQELMHALCARILELQQDDRENYMQMYSLHVAEPIAGVEIPQGPFCFKLRGRYYAKDTIDDLIPIDRVVYDYLSKTRKVSFVPQTLPKNVKFYTYTPWQFVELYNMDHMVYTAPSSNDLLIAKLSLADDGMFSPECIPVFAVLCVN